MRHARTALARTVPALLAISALAVPVNAAAAPAEQSGDITIQGKCGEGFSPSVGGGEAAWNIYCGGGTIRVQGWVKDTSADGKAAELYGAWGDNATFPTVRAGGEGKTVRFNKKHSGTSEVTIRLRVI